MPITTSLIIAFKGALFLSKSAAAKAAIMKYGSYILATKGIAATVATGMTVATAAGSFVVIKSIPENSIKGFSQIINGMSKGSIADFMDGVYKLSKVYSTTNSLISDFNDFVDSGNCAPEVKISLKKSIKGIEGILKNEIEHKTYQLLKDVENHLANYGYTGESYSERINTIYYKHTYDLTDNYIELLGRGGRIYSDISEFNQSLGIGEFYEYDHYLTYCIAGWFIDNITLSCIANVSQDKLAKDITDQILSYLKAYNL